MVLFFVIITMALVCIIVIFNSSFKLSISKLKIDTENGNIDYEIKFGLYFMKKIRIIGLKLNKDKQEKIKRKIQKLQNSKLIKKLSKTSIKKIPLKLEKKLEREILFNNIKPLKLAKIIFKNLKIEILKFKMNLQIGLEDVIITSSLITIISVIVPIILRLTNKYIKNINNYRYKILPIYGNKNVLKLDLDCIINLKLVHIINIIYIIVKMKRRSDKNERTSNRRSYDYCHE
jgi:hypothetical protein